MSALAGSAGASMSKPPVWHACSEERGDPKEENEKATQMRSEKVLTLPLLGCDLPGGNRIPDFLFCTPAALPGKMLQSTSP